MNKLLLTGATGFLGAALVKQIERDSCYSLVTAVRNNPQNQNLKSKSILVGSLSSDTDWSSALSGVNVVIHAAARVHVMNEQSVDPLIEFRKVNFEGTMALARQAEQAGITRFIFISSIKVNGERTERDRPFTAEDVPNPVDPYAISKAETERALMELAASSNMDVVIIRPVLVYGPGVKANFQNLMKWLKLGIPLPLGLIHNKRSLVALDNLVDLIITCIKHPAAANQIFLVSDGDDLSTTELLRRTGRALNSPARLIPVPEWLIGLLASLMGKRNVAQRLLGSLQVDILKTRLLLDWEPPVSVDKGLKKTTQYFLMNK